MPSPIPVPVRQAIFKRWQKGESLSRLAEDFKIPVRTIRNLVRRFSQRGQEGLEPDYGRCATRTLPTDSESYQKAMELRRQHPKWGSGLIRIFLQKQHSVGCPSERTLQRWFRQATMPEAPPGRRPAGNDHRAQRPHEVWQMDAVEQLRLGSGHRVSWLRVVDECSGAVLQTTIFPPSLLEPSDAGRGARHVASDFFAVGKAWASARR